MGGVSTHASRDRILKIPRSSVVTCLSFKREQNASLPRWFFWVFLLRYYFKKASDEFACGAVFEEIWDDETVLPMYEGRILGKVERID